MTTKNGMYRGWGLYCKYGQMGINSLNHLGYIFVAIQKQTHSVTVLDLLFFGHKASRNHSTLPTVSKVLW